MQNTRTINQRDIVVQRQCRVTEAMTSNLSWLASSYAQGFRVGWRAGCKAEGRRSGRGVADEPLVVTRGDSESVVIEMLLQVQASIGQACQIGTQ